MKKIALAYLLFVLAACSKKTDQDTDKPVLTLNTPSNNQSYSAGQNIMISGTASDNRFLNQIHIVITNLSTGTEYLHVHIHPSSSSFNFSQPYTAQAGINYKIEVIADDPSSNSTSKTVQVTCN